MDGVGVIVILAGALLLGVIFAAWLFPIFFAGFMSYLMYLDEVAAEQPEQPEQASDDDPNITPA